MAIKISHSHFVHVAFVSILVFQTFDRMIFGRWSFLEQGSTRWQYGTYKWYAIRKRLGTTGLEQQRLFPLCKLTENKTAKRSYLRYEARGADNAGIHTLYWNTKARLDYRWEQLRAAVIRALLCHRRVIYFWWSRTPIPAVTLDFFRPTFASLRHVSPWSWCEAPITNKLSSTRCRRINDASYL